MGKKGFRWFLSLKNLIFLFSFSILVSSSLFADRYRGSPRPKRTCVEAITEIYGDIQDMSMYDLWNLYKTTSSSTEKLNIRNFLIEKYRHLVTMHAEKIHARLPNEVDIEDLKAVGVLGLIDAINGFDLSRGNKFETYSAPRIRGAILDELRKMDWVPRLARSRSTKVNEARDEFRKRNGYLPSERELAVLLSTGVNGQTMSKSNAQKIIKDGSQVARKSSLYQKKGRAADGHREISEIDTIADQRLKSPTVTLQRKYLFESIAKSLSRAERLLILLYYNEGMSMKDVGKTLDLSESRVSQMHSSILRRLKAQLTSSQISELEEASARSD